MTDPSEESGVVPSDRGTGREGAPEPRQVVVLLPSSDGGSGWLRIKWLLPWILAALALLAVGYYGAEEFGWLDSDPRSVERGAERATGETSPTESTLAMTRFRQVADSLDRALRRYADRRSDFAGDRLGCTGLRGAFEAVDRRFVSLSVIFREDGEHLRSVARDRYLELSDQVDEVNHHFDSVDCRGGR